MQSSRKIRHPHKRLQHLAGRHLLSFLFPDFPRGEIEIGGTNKPFLPSKLYDFSISHCRQFAAAIVSLGERVGVDVELVTPQVEKIKNKFLNADEVRFVDAQVPTIQLTLLTVLWCAKEAMYKWYGLGKVDFREMLRVSPFVLTIEGDIEATFTKGIYQEKLTLRYIIIEGLCLVWAATP
jgi:phosphopantetheinyl transferase